MTPYSTFNTSLIMQQGCILEGILGVKIPISLKNFFNLLEFFENIQTFPYIQYKKISTPPLKYFWLRLFNALSLDRRRTKKFFRGGSSNFLYGRKILGELWDFQGWGTHRYFNQKWSILIFNQKTLTNWRNFKSRGVTLLWTHPTYTL